MSGAFFSLVRRDLRSAWRGGGIGLPVIFMLLVASLFPFAVGPDAGLLAATGGGMLWIAALLAALLPIDRLIAPDREAGMLDQFRLQGLSDELVACAKLLAHWIGFGPAVMVAALPAAALLKLDSAVVMQLELGLALGTPGLAALGLLVAGLTANLRGAGALGGLLVLPLAIPLLIFGAGSLDAGSGAAIKFLAALSLLLIGITPFAVGAAIRAGRE